MLTNAQRIVDKARKYLLDVAGKQQGTTWSDADIIDAANEEQEGLVATCVEGHEDYFMAQTTLAMQDGQNSYPLFDGFLLLRKLEFTPSGSSDPVGDAQDVIESRLIEGVQGAAGIASATESQYYYALNGDNLDIQPTPGFSGGSMNAWIIRAPGPILLEIPRSIDAADKLTLSSVDAPIESDVLIGTFVDVVAGTGLRQRRRITVYNGPIAQVTFDSAFGVPLDGTSKIATVSRLPRLFHEMLYLGAAIRCLAQQRESANDIKALYNDRQEAFIDFVERPRTYGQRGVVPFDADDGI